MESAKIIGIEHSLTATSIKHDVEELISKNEADTCNLKILLVGGADAESANLYIQCLNPLFPDRKLYKTGAKCITRHYERAFPHAKSLNMLQSYLAYREAKQAGAYDTLVVNRNECVTEGTRTNFFAIKDHEIISPPSAEILLGVTRDHMLRVAKENGFSIVENDIKLSDLESYDGFFITSTSSKVMPVSNIDGQDYEIPESIRELMSAYDQFLSRL